MGKLINNIEDLSPGTKKKIQNACDKSIKVRFSQWSKEFEYESPTGNKMIELTIDTKDFDRNCILVAEELIRLRKYYHKANKEFIPPDNFNDIKELKKNNNNKKIKDLMELLNKDKTEKVQKYLPLKGLARYGIPQLSDIDIYQPKTNASTVASMGSGQTGKTTLMVHVMKKLYDNPNWIGYLYTLSPTIKAFSVLNEIKIRPGFEKADEYMIEMMKYVNSNTDNKYPFINFFDDILEEGNKHNKVIDRLCLIYRNALLSTWLSTQYPKLINKKNRSNINSFVLFRFHQMDYLEEVIKSFLKPYFLKILGKCNMDDMIELYHTATEDHGFIYISPFQDSISFHKLKL